MKKLDVLRQNIRNMQKMIIAFSGRVDSTFLLEIAYEELNEMEDIKMLKN